MKALFGGVIAVVLLGINVRLFVGLAAFMKGMYHPKALPAFTGIGQSWLGLAVASAYAYFKIEPK